MTVVVTTPSIRKAIRKAVQAALLDKTAAGSRVSTNRAEAVWRTGLPAIEIYTLDEDVDGFAVESPRVYRRAAEVAVELFVEEADVGGVRLPADDQLDDLAEQVETILFGSHDAYGLGENLEYTGTEIGFDSAGAKLAGAARVKFLATYLTEAPERDDEAPFNLARVEWDLAPVDVIHATDDIALTGG